MTDSRRQLLVTVLAVIASTAGVTSAANVVLNWRSVAASATAVKILELESKKLDALTSELAELRSACSATRAVQAVVNPVNAPNPSAALPAERIEALANVLAERLRPEEPESPPRDAETIAAFSDATRLFETALASKRWTDGDVSALQAVAGRLHSDDLVELRRQIAVAINRGDMSLETRELF